MLQAGMGWVSERTITKKPRNINRVKVGGKEEAFYAVSVEIMIMMLLGN
jgi:hypothetical protein